MTTLQEDLDAAGAENSPSVAAAVAAALAAETPAEPGMEATTLPLPRDDGAETG